MNQPVSRFVSFRRSDSDIDPENPFKDDQLERNDLAERLSRFLARVDGPFTMALTGAYGSGKTHFLRRCDALFRKKHIPTVLVNIWESDFASDPLAPIISELSEKFSGKLKTGESRWRKAKDLAAKVAAASVPTALKVAIDAIPGAGAVADAVEKLAEKQFEHFAAAKKKRRRPKEGAYKAYRSDS